MVRNVVSADQIKEHIAQHLKWDSSLKGSQIKVDYVGRTAVLSGTVPNLMAHTMAQRDALNIPGVDLVENRLTVQFTHEHPDRNDIEVQADVETVLGCTSNLGSKSIKVSVQDGIVTLEGNIDSYWKMDRVQDLAASVDGVLEIKNRIRVSPKEKAPDNAIKRELMSALERMEVDGLDKVAIDVKNGVVSLSGNVPTWDTSFDIEDTARFTAGVTGVKNNLSVD